MSQDQNDNNNNDNNRPLVIRHSPPRATINRAFIPYDKAYRPNRSPSNILRMISRLPHRSIPDSSGEVQPPTFQAKSPPPPVPKEYGDSYAQFKEQYMKIRRVDPDARQLRPGVQLDFIHKKVRHLDTFSDTLSEFTFHTTTNYSRLNIDTQTQLLQNPSRKQQEKYYIEDDARSLATQDMLLDEDDGQVVLDSQQILELQRKMELIPTSSMQFEEQKQVQPSPLLSHHSFKQDIQPIPSLPSQKSNTPSIISQKSDIRDKGKEKEHVVMDSPSKDSIPEIIQDKVMEEILNDIGSDWGMDDDYGDNNWEYDNEHAVIEEQSDTKNSRVVKRVVPGASSIDVEPESLIHERRPFGQQYVRDRFSNKLDFNTRLITAVSYFDKVWDAYANQMSHDLKAYIKHRENNEEDDNTLLKEDVLLLMKRQRVINEQSSLESVAYKHLPRESWDILCTSALKNNILYPPLRTSILSSTYDNDDEEEEEDDETVPDHHPDHRIDFD